MNKDSRLLLRTKKRRFSSGSSPVNVITGDGTWQRHRSSAQIVRPGCPPSRDASNCAKTFSLRKEVIQPQVLLRLPCYDFTPIMNYPLGGCSLAVSAPTSSATPFRDVTGGVYKARERIHRGVLIRDY